MWHEVNITHEWYTLYDYFVWNSYKNKTSIYVPTIEKKILAANIEDLRRRGGPTERWKYVVVELIKQERIEYKVWDQMP